MAQYREIKNKHGDAILFFRLGDFYEMFFEDAIEASQLLQITLTARSKGPDATPMCGVPYHAADGYIAKLTRLGKKVAICEQLSDPGLPGIVQRDVIRIITPGTTLDDNVLQQKANNYVLAIVPAGLPGATHFDIAFADVTTGEFLETKIENEKMLISEIQRIGPTEVILTPSSFTHPSVELLRRNLPQVFFFPHDISGNDISAETLLTDYLKGTQKNSLEHMGKAEPYDIHEFMALDESTLKNLELLTTLRENGKEGSLLWVLDRTSTSMGGRMLRHFVTHPLLRKKEIELRLDSVGELEKNQQLLGDVREILKSVMDLERLISRISLGRGSARDLVGICQSLLTVPKFQQMLGGCFSHLLKDVRDSIDALPDVTGLIQRAIVEAPPLSITEGGIIADGYNAELDELKKISRDGKGFIRNLQEQEIAATGISNMKVRYNKIFGYYLEVSKSHVSKVPQHYIRKQTVVNAERYITPELKEFEEKVLGAEEKIVALEQKIFQEIR
ncbi:MAG TPA: DNA mismatch repair protein MutS, partial [Candidatus Gracilibacteria bacterium]|nr:DNA mismatch repair protein MutS [Candidatus Gracilibacteria bacterium]